MNTGTVCCMRFFSETFKNLPKYMAAVISGIVPSPNKAIYKLPYSALCIEIEAKTAIYRSPHGKNPLRKPMVKNVSAVLFCNDFPNSDFILEIILKSGFEKLYLLNS